MPSRKKKGTKLKQIIQVHNLKDLKRLNDDKLYELSMMKLSPDARHEIEREFHERTVMMVGFDFIELKPEKMPWSLFYITINDIIKDIILVTTEHENVKSATKQVYNSFRPIMISLGRKKIKRPNKKPSRRSNVSHHPFTSDDARTYNDKLCGSPELFSQIFRGRITMIAMLYLSTLLRMGYFPMIYQGEIRYSTSSEIIPELNESANRDLDINEPIDEADASTMMIEEVNMIREAGVVCAIAGDLDALEWLIDQYYDLVDDRVFTSTIKSDNDVSLNFLIDKLDCFNPEYKPHICYLDLAFEMGSITVAKSLMEILIDEWSDRILKENESFRDKDLINQAKSGQIPETAIPFIKALNKGCIKSIEFISNIIDISAIPGFLFAGIKYGNVHTMAALIDKLKFTPSDDWINVLTISINTNEDLTEEKQKVFNYLMARGFTPTTKINKVIGRTIVKTYSGGNLQVDIPHTDLTLGIVSGHRHIPGSRR